MQTGTIKKLVSDRGFGFIAADDGKEYFFHRSSTEADFDAAFRRIKERDLPYWADPGRKQKSEIYTHNGGRGLYFQDPSGHLLEILTRPYGSDG